MVESNAEMKEADDDTPRAPRPAGKTGPDPALRRRICTFVRDGIALGRWRPGERLPDRTWFMRRFHCTPTATQAAFAQLVREGFVWSRARAGTFVSDPPPFAGRYLYIGNAPESELPIGDGFAIRESIRILESERGIHFDYVPKISTLEAEPPARTTLLADIRAHRWAGVFLQTWSDEALAKGKVRLDTVPICLNAGLPGSVARGFTGSLVKRIHQEGLSADPLARLDGLLDDCAAAGGRHVAIFAHQNDKMPFLADAAARKARERGLELGPFHYQALQMIGRQDGTRGAIRAFMLAMLHAWRDWEPDCVILMDDHFLPPFEDALREFTIKGAKCKAKGDEKTDAGRRRPFVACIGNKPTLPETRLDVRFRGFDHLETLRSFLDWCEAIHAGAKAPPRPVLATF